MTETLDDSTSQIDVDLSKQSPKMRIKASPLHPRRSDKTRDDSVRRDSFSNLHLFPNVS